MIKIILILISSFFISWNYIDDNSTQDLEIDSSEPSITPSYSREKLLETRSNCFQDETKIKNKKVEYYWDDPESFVWE